jgi:peroxiredoxin
VSINSLSEKDKNYASDSALKTFAKENGLRVRVLRDADQEAFRAFGFDALPSVVIIDRQGQVYQKQVGFSMEQPQGFSALTKSLNELLRKARG